MVTVVLGCLSFFMLCLRLSLSLFFFLSLPPLSLSPSPLLQMHKSTILIWFGKRNCANKNKTKQKHTTNANLRDANSIPADLCLLILHLLTVFYIHIVLLPFFNCFVAFEVWPFPNIFNSNWKLNDFWLVQLKPLTENVIQNLKGKLFSYFGREEIPAWLPQFIFGPIHLQSNSSPIQFISNPILSARPIHFQYSTEKCIFPAIHFSWDYVSRVRARLDQTKSD